MTSPSHLFSLYTPFFGNLEIRVVDGSLSPIARNGSTVILENQTLKLVLHMPNLSCKRLSISKITKESNFSAKFFDFHCELQEPRSRRMIGSAGEVDEFFYFDGDLLKSGQAQATGSNVISILVESEIMLRHCMSNHLSFPHLKQWFPSLFKNSNPLLFQCES